MKIKLLLPFLLIMLLACGGSKKTSITKNPKSKVFYNQSEELVDVLDFAKQHNKMVFLYVYTDWCLPCKIFEEEVLNNQSSANFLNDNFINYKINAEKSEGPDITLIYSVGSYPALLFLDYRGRVIDRHVGGIGIQKFNSLTERVLEKGIDPF